MKIVNYLDVTLDLNTGTYKPFTKPDNEINYVHVQSNHPPNVIKQIPKSIQTRLSNLSSNEDVFNNAKPIYAEALQRSGHVHELRYAPNRNQHTRNRKRKIIWFNPPFNANLATNIGKFFLKLVKKHFKRGSRFHKIFNKNTLKVSYSCMPNVKSIINAHNKKILTPTSDEIDQRTCNCNRKNECPLNQNCLQSSVVYEATISSDEPNYRPMKYIGLCETTFKQRYGSHKSSFNNERYRNNTTLSAEYWRIKDNNFTPSVNWRVIRKAAAYTPETKKCRLCLSEKTEIACYPDTNLLNKRSEVIAKCRHRRKHKLFINADTPID